MITEDYVSFEVAKLLKEKGFDDTCISVYHDGKLQLVSSLGVFCGEGYGEQILTYTNSECEWSPIMISAPTLQMAMKWLREVKHIPIEILWHYDSNSDAEEWYFIHHAELRILPNDIEYYETYEEAIESAIKYCLKNLI